jgi:hypothetical protein
MQRRSRDRVGRVEELISVRLKKRGRGEPPAYHHVLHHATAVAAIVLSGEPRVDEPLAQAWARAVRHYDINKPPQGLDGTTAIQRLVPIILAGQNAAPRFTEIFSTAPVWLLQFTGIAMDARLLKFQLPDLSGTLKWGSDGFEDARRWPSLPLNTMTAGDPIPEIDARQLRIALFCMITIPIPDSWDDISLEDEENSYRRNDPLLDDICFALDLDEKPEEKWSRYEKRRMRRLAERISRL